MKYLVESIFMLYLCLVVEPLTKTQQHKCYESLSETSREEVRHQAGVEHESGHHEPGHGSLRKTQPECLR